MDKEGDWQHILPLNLYQHKGASFSITVSLMSHIIPSNSLVLLYAASSLKAGETHHTPQMFQPLLSQESQHFKWEVN